MARPGTALIALVFATAAVAGTPAWADRGGGRFDRDHPVYRRGHQHPSFGHRDHRDHRDDRWVAGLGLLAGTAVFLAATQPRQVAYSTPVQVYTPLPVYSPPPAPVLAYANPTHQWWYYCTQPVGYYPYVQQCPAGWIRVSPRPPG